MATRRPIPKKSADRQRCRMTAQRNPDTLLIPAIRWGREDVLFTPAYWADAAAQFESSVGERISFRLGNSFKEECVACMLGGHGIPGEVGNAAFESLRSAGAFDHKHVATSDILDVLQAPLTLASGRQIRYRFPNTKSAVIAALLNSDPTPPPRLSENAVRDWLTQFSGIGLKTASWIVRNWYGSDAVAIIDIHIYRAGLLAGFIEAADRLPKDYRAIERRFLAFSAGIGVRPSILDSVIWMHMRRAGRLVGTYLEAEFGAVKSHRKVAVAA